MRFPKFRAHRAWRHVERERAHRSWTAAVPCTRVDSGLLHSRPAAVQVSNDDHFFWTHPVEKAIVEHEEFAQIRLVQFGNDATALGELIE
jgi:hypothetical protein